MWTGRLRNVQAACREDDDPETNGMPPCPDYTLPACTKSELRCLHRVTGDATTHYLVGAT